MPFSLADVVYGGIVPVIVAAALWRLSARRLTTEGLRRGATAGAFVAGVHGGYWLLELGDPVPGSHWEWLPWALLLSVVGAVPPAAGSRGRLLSHVLMLSVAVAASGALVPGWEHLEPSRWIHILALSAVIVLVAAGLEPLTRRMSAAPLLLVLGLVLVCEAAILALSGSLRFAQIAGCGAAALMGLSLAAWFDRTGRPSAGIALPFAVLAAGMMHIGKVNSFSDVPLISYLLPPLAPLALWAVILDCGPRSTGPRRLLLLSLPVLLSLVALGIAAVA